MTSNVGADANSNLTASASSPNMVSQSQPYVEFQQTRMPVSTAAYAVPLSLAGSIILIATFLGIHHHRKLLMDRANEREQEKSLGLGRRLSLWNRRPPSGSSSVRDGKKHEDGEPDTLTRPYVPNLLYTNRPQARQPTRSPFVNSPITTRGHTGHATAPVSLFRSTLSPRIPHSPRPGSEREDGINASVNDGVVSHYLQLSPIPPFFSSPHTAPTPPKPAHTRKCVAAELVPESEKLQSSDHIYDEVARKLVDKI